MFLSALEQKTSHRQNRASRPKVRTGCATCKTRRVKCDEQKPICSRCVSAGRECTGYGYRSQLPHLGGFYSANQPMSICKPLFSIPEVNSQELMSFDFFRSQTAHDLPGLFQSHFWGSLIPQISHSEPDVFHACVALGSLHQKAVTEKMSIPSQDPTNKHLQFGLQQFNKSILYLQNRSTAHKDQRYSEVVLLTCILFISIEILRGHYGTAMLHLQNGRNLLRDYMFQQRETGQDNVLILRTSSHSLSDGLVEAFARLDIQSPNFGLKGPHFRLLTEKSITSPAARPIDCFPSLAEARQNFDSLMNASFRFLMRILDSAFYKEEPQKAIKDRDDVLLETHNWYLAFENYRRSTTLSQADEYKARILQLYHRYLHIQVSVSLNDGVEKVFDKFTADFEAIVTLAETLTCGRGVASCLPSFSLDIGIIQPLYFTAIKCRIPHLRRRALSTLYSTPHREGMWDAAILSTLAARIVQLEESVWEGQNHQEALTLPESARFYQVLAIIIGEGTEGIQLHCKRRHLAFVGDENVREEHCAFDDGALIRELLQT